LFRLTLIAVGCIAALLAIAGVLLPGLPTTPFLLIALWAFARSSERLYAGIMRLPILREAMIEARRFEDRRAVRPAVKLMAVATAWSSVLLTFLAFGDTRPALLATIVMAALGATAFMAWIPSDHSDMN
jgi:uncharacterized membrane protein YbaN (DUF454 family)